MTERKTRSETDTRIREGLGVCSEWVTDASGEMRKDCIRCPFQDPNDPAGMACGERLMHDAGLLIDELKRNIRKLRAEADFLRGQLTLMESEAKRIP